MFGFKRDVTHELNNIWAHINTFSKWTNTINKGIPTFNKMIEKQKQLEELCANLLTVAAKMDEKIKKIENERTIQKTKTTQKKIWNRKSK